MTSGDLAISRSSDPIARSPDRQTSMANREIEYQQAMAYIQHMYDTRHQIFQFAVALNTALLAAIFQFVKTDSGQLALSALGGVVTIAVTLMARRSHAYLVVLEQYVMELETELGFGLVKTTGARMPKGIDSTLYLHFIYWLLVFVWLALIGYFALDF
jgi:hypothetical protein